MSFHGNKGYCLRTQNFCSWIRSRPIKCFIIETLLQPTTVKGIRSFLGHASFYRISIKGFSKIPIPLCRLLEKEAKLVFDELCKAAFDEIKSKLVFAPIMVTLDWNKEFEIMCDPSDYAMGDVFGQRTFKISRPYTMPTKPSMKHKRTALQLKKRCSPWCVLVKNLGLTYWGSML